jgi:hypothetical protein
MTIVGVLLAIGGGILALDYRGWGAKYIGLGLSRRIWSDERRQRMIKIYRVNYAFAAVVGIIIVISEVVGHA